MTNPKGSEIAPTELPRPTPNFSNDAQPRVRIKMRRNIVGMTVAVIAFILSSSSIAQELAQEQPSMPVVLDDVTISGWHAFWLTIFDSDSLCTPSVSFIVTNTSSKIIDSVDFTLTVLDPVAKRVFANGSTFWLSKPLPPGYSRGVVLNSTTGYPYELGACARHFPNLIAWVRFGEKDIARGPVSQETYGIMPGEPLENLAEKLAHKDDETHDVSH